MGVNVNVGFAASVKYRSSGFTVALDKVTLGDKRTSTVAVWAYWVEIKFGVRPASMDGEGVTLARVGGMGSGERVNVVSGEKEFSDRDELQAETIGARISANDSKAERRFTIGEDFTIICQEKRICRPIS